MIQDARVYSMMVEHDRVVPAMEQIDQIMDALLDHDRDRGTPMIEVIEQTIIEHNSIMIGSCGSLRPSVLVPVSVVGGV